MICLVWFQVRDSNHLQDSFKELATGHEGGLTEADVDDLFSFGPWRAWWPAMITTEMVPRLCGVSVAQRQAPTSTLMSGLVDCICQPKVPETDTFHMENMNQSVCRFECYDFSLQYSSSFFWIRHTCIEVCWATLDTSLDESNKGLDTICSLSPSLWFILSLDIVATSFQAI